MVQHLEIGMEYPRLVGDNKQVETERGCKDEK
jgi:hypothetical protein